jgi:hypothetical protein
VYVSEYRTAQHAGELKKTGLHLWACEAELFPSLAHRTCCAKRPAGSPWTLAQTSFPNDLRCANEHGIRVGERLGLERNDRLFNDFRRHAILLRQARRTGPA